MGLLGYALKSVIRHPRRSVAALLGVALAVAFIGGTFVAIDSSAQAFLQGRLDRIDVDMTAFLETEEVRGAVDDVRAIDEVTGAIPSASVSAFEFTATESSAEVIGTLRGIWPDDPPLDLRDLRLQGTLTLAENRTVIPEGLASVLGVDIGDTLTVRPLSSVDPSDPGPHPAVNLTVEGILLESPEEAFLEPLERSFILVHLDGLPTIETRLGSTGPSTVLLQISIDRDRLIDPYDLEGSRRNLARLERAVEETLEPYGPLSVNERLSAALVGVESQGTILRLIFLFVAIPILFLGLYVGVVGVDLAHGERRRELAILRTRGAGARQALALLLLESVVLGFLAGALGLLGGLALGQSLIPAVSTFGGTPADAPRVTLSAGTVAAALLFGVAFVFLVSFRSARRTASLPLGESLAAYAPGEAHLDYSPKVDLVLVGVGTFVLATVLYAQVSPGGFLLFLVGVIAFVLAPFVPALFLIGATRVLTLSSSRVYDWAVRVLKPVAGTLYPLIRRNLTRNPRRSSHLAVIVAVGLAFGVLSSTMLASQVAWEEGQLRSMLGADLVATPPLTDAGFLENLTATDGVAGATPLVRFGAADNVAGGRFVRVLAVDPVGFFDVAQIEEWHTAPLDATEAREVMAQPGQVLVSRAYAQENALEVGDVLALQTEETFEEEVPSHAVRVGGIVRGLPGSLTQDNPVQYHLPYALFGGLETLRPLLLAPLVTGGIPLPPPGGFETGVRVLVDLDPDADWQTVKAAVLDRGGVDVVVYEEERQKAPFSPVTQSLVAFLRLEAFFAVVVLTAGIGLVLYAASLERPLEMAGIAVRGASRRVLAGLLWGEVLVIILVGVLVGVGTGLVGGYLGTQTFLVGPPGTETLTPFLLVVPLEVAWFALLAFGAMSLAALAMAWRVSRTDWARVLKVRAR